METKFSINLSSFAELHEDLKGRDLQEASQSQVGTESKRLLRSDTSSGSCPGRPHVLPVECIICRTTKYVRESYSHKRKVEKLIRCETLTCGQLVKAAEIRNDEHLLIKIRGKDLAALEARYHRSCYLSYCRVVRQKEEGGEGLKQYEAAYAKFCQSVMCHDRLTFVIDSNGFDFQNMWIPVYLTMPSYDC